jgi:hypothetical protein
MMKLLLATILLVGLAFVSAEITPRFPPEQPVTVSQDAGSNIINGTVLPCDFDYYRIETLSNVQDTDWLRFQFDQTPEAEGDFGTFYVVYSEFDDLEKELTDNNNIVDTLGELPGPDNYLWKCSEASCLIELSCKLQNGTYYVGVTAGAASILSYSFNLTTGVVTIDTIKDGEPLIVFNDQRDIPVAPARLYNYAFYAIDIPEDQFAEGAYLLVNISRVSAPGTVVRLHYDDLPVTALDNGNLDENDEFDECIYAGCVDTAAAAGEFIFDYPVNTQPRKSCECTTFEQIVGGGRQLTCNLTVDPCQMLYGRWYISVELPFRIDENDDTGLDYTLYATLITPTISELTRNTTYKGYVEPERLTHYKVNVPASEVAAGQTHLLVHIDNVRNGFVDVWIHQGLDGQADPRAGGIESCYIANTTCRTDDACNVVVEKCHFGPGTWYISVSIASDEDGFLVDDFDRLPISYTIRANWLEDAVPTTLVAGVPVHKYIGEALYDFYVIEVPPTIDTWLFVELYAQQEDTEVILSMLHGSLPGGECYDRPDFYCLTGDVRSGRTIQTGPAEDYVFRTNARESCTFMIQTCELEQGPLYLSVYGHHVGYSAYGDTTYYQVPVHYTLYADFDVALSIQSAISYSENVFERQYNHYYIRADTVVQGQYLSVEVTNIQHGIPQTLEAFVNYNYLAGNCPCYDHLYNCTGAVAPACGDNVPETVANFLPEVDQVKDFCTILVPACAFRSGVWYISVLGVNEDLHQYTTPIGYTLTATIHDAPVIKPLIPGQAIADVVTQWNTTNQYTHYKVGAKPIPNHDLVIKVTYVQNSDFLSKHDNLRDALDIFVNRGGVAGDRCFDYSGRANIASSSYETVVIPACEWTDDEYFVAIQGNFGAIFPGRYTIELRVVEITDTQLVSGVSVYGRVADHRYQHFFIDVPQDFTGNDLFIELYTNSDQDKVTAFLNKDYRAGEDQCYDYLYRCETESSCSWQIEACEVTGGRYYISVYGDEHQFYDIAVEFTLTATLKDTVTPLGADQPYTAHIQAGQIQHYSLLVQNSKVGDYITFLVDNVKHGDVEVFYNFENLAGNCPCYDYVKKCTPGDSAPGNGLTNNWCEITVPSCEFTDGTYYFSVVGLENTTPNPPLYETPIGYTIEVDYITPTFVRPNVVRDRFEENTDAFQFVANERYIHYRVDVDQDDYDEGYQVIVEIKNVQEGALSVFWSDEEPSASAPSCQIAQICTSGLGAGSECYWQIPYCLSTPGRHYVTVQGITGRLQASFDILIYLQRPATVAQSSNFTLDDASSAFIFPAGAELNITHTKTHEPNGWVQMINLDNLSVSDTDNGEILEIFFYRVVNNLAQPLAFNVYLNVDSPAGSDTCCVGTNEETFDSPTPVDQGNCIRQPCAKSVPLTTYNPGNIIVPAGGPGAQPSRGAPGPRDDSQNNNLCLPTQVGTGSADPSLGASPYYGERCIVRVWACDLAAAQADAETSNWFLTVVPVAAPAPTAAPLNGLSYSVQWRVRNVRTDATTDANGSVDLTSQINIVDAPFTTQEYTVTTVTTEAEGFGSFLIDVTELSSDDETNGRRVVIQTEFINGTGVVYIQPETFANPIGCNDYVCFSTEDCNDQLRFISSECCDLDVTRFYITVRNLGGTGTATSFRFRITEIVQPAVVEVTLPYNIEVGTNVTDGLRGEEYDFYTFPITADDLDFTNLVINITKLNNPGETLVVYVNFEALAGSDTGSQTDLYPTDEACYNYLYHLDVTGEEIYTLELSHCQLVPGDWYVSVFSPSFDLIGGQEDFQSYNLSIYFSEPPTDLSLDESRTDTYTPFGSSFFQYKLEVTAEDIEASNNGVDGFLTNFLHIEVSNFDGDIALFVNFDDIAGDDAYPNACNGNIAFDETCASGSCIVEILPCDSAFTLKAGTYYIGVRVNGAGTWNVTATIVSETYTEITSTTEDGDGHRIDTTNTIFTVASEAAASPSEDGYYRYAINIADEFTSGRDYLIVNLTSTSDGLVSDLSVEVFSQSCVQWDCAVDSALGWCVIDAVGLAPCTAKAGTYFFRVFNPSNSAFTLTVYQNETTVQDLEDGQTITEIIYPVEYEAYYYETEAIGVDASTLTVEITSTCGSVEVFIQKDTIGGPSSDDGECSISSCVTSGTGETKTCTLFLDVCTYEQRGYYITVRGNNQEFPNESNPNLYLPIRYTLKATQTNVTTIPIAANCPAVVQYTTDETDEPIQFYYDLENAEVGSTLRFTLSVPSQVFDADKEATITITFQSPVTYSGDDCTYPLEPLSCTVGSDDAHCSISTIRLCNSIEGRYYIWADAPRGSVVYVELYDAVIPIVDDGEVISATINSDNDEHLDFPYRPNVQYYRYDVEPKNDEHFLLTIRVSEISQGTVSVYTSLGQYPIIADDSSDNCFAVPLDEFSCTNVEEGQECVLNLGFCDLDYPGELPGYHPTTLWVIIVGESQTCELHSIKYNIEFERHNEPTIFEANQAVCQTAEDGEYSNFHLSSRTKSRPQDYVLNFIAKDITGGNIKLNIIDNEGFPATENCADFNTEFTSADIDFYYICGFNDLTFTVLGDSDNGASIDYNLAVNQVSILLNQLEEDVPFVKDESCSTANRQPTGFDYFYYKRSTSRSTLSYISFIVETLSEDTVLEIYPRTTLLGGPGCVDDEDVLTIEQIAPGVYRVLDTGCSDFAKDYYLTISATGPYQVTAKVGKEILDLALQDSTDVLIPVGETIVYKLEITSDDIATADSRLVLEFSGIVGPSFVATINSGDRASTGLFCNIDKFAADSNESSYFVLEVPTCEFTDGTYYITLTQQANPETDVTTCANVTVVLTAVVVPYEIDITSVNINTVLTGETVSLITRDVNAETPFKFYRIKSALNADEAFGQARLLNVEGGTVTLFVTESSFSIPTEAWFPGSRFGTHRTYPISGVIPHVTASSISNDFTVLPCGADGCADACCTAEDSCAITVTPCTWGSASYYLAVAAVSQDAADVPITFDLVLEEYSKYTEITPNSNKVDTFDGNFANHYYAGITDGQQSIRFRTQVINGDGVLVTVRNHQCPEQATWIREVYCSSRFYDNEFQCDVDVSTRAQHPGSLTTTFFATVTGSNATYSISFFAGRQNCHDFTGTGSREGLNFCQSLVPYSTYRWDDYSKRDSAAKCLFNELYDHFRVQPCWSGVTVDCNSTLQRFACYENFHRCDADGFAVGTCRKACEAVVYECVNWFESVDLEHYNCTSPRYIDSNHACTGHLENDAYDTIPALIDDPLDIIYENDLPRGAASSLSTSFALVFLALIAALFF